jgi:urate oxidase
MPSNNFSNSWFSRPTSRGGTRRACCSRVERRAAIGWRYTDVGAALADDPARSVAAEQVGDLAAAVFHDFASLSIQHLLHEIRQRMLDRWPQLAEVSFDAQNRPWDLAAESDDDPRVK